MYVTDLECDCGHRFEAWFRSAQDLDRQTERDLIECPACQATTVRKLPAGPHVRKSAAPAQKTAAASMAEQMRALRQRLLAMAADAEDVGRQFPVEARRIHYGEAEDRNIKGAATSGEVRELLEEGIPILPVPTDKKGNTH